MVTHDECRLQTEIMVAEASGVERTHMMIDSHLQLFAFRENFRLMEWGTAELIRKTAPLLQSKNICGRSAVITSGVPQIPKPLF